MRFYGIPSEDRALEILESLPEGLWVFKDNSLQVQLSSKEVKEKLREIILIVKSWKKEKNTYHRPQPLCSFIHQQSQSTLRYTTFLPLAVV